jgi:hypothetical protein
MINPPGMDQLGGMLDVDFAIRCITTMVKCWDPARATLTSNELRESQSKPVGLVHCFYRGAFSDARYIMGRS